MPSGRWRPRDDDDFEDDRPRRRRDDDEDDLDDRPRRRRDQERPMRRPRRKSRGPNTGLVIGLVFGVLGLAVVIVVAGLGAALPWHQAVFTYVGPTMAGALAMLPASLGAAEFGLTALIHDLAQPVPPLAVAAAAALVIRLATLWLPLVIGGGALILLRLAPPGRVVAV